MSDYESGRIQKLFKLLAGNKLLLRDEASRSLLALVKSQPCRAAQVNMRPNSVSIFYSV